MSILGDHHVNEAILDEMPAVTQMVKTLARRFERVTAMRCADIYEIHSPEAARKIRDEFGVPQQTEADHFFDHLGEEVLARVEKALKELKKGA